MSEENETGEDTPKSSDEFEFYFAFTKPLVLDLPSSEDRAIAAAWVQKLEAEPESEEEKEQRLNYLKLLLFVLQRGRLSGIFKKQPPTGPLQPFPQGFSILDMGNWMLDQDDSGPCGAGDARPVPYTMELSNDLREYVAAQEIPNFGIQMYYAWSSEDPIHKWSSFDEEKFPQFILEKIRQLKEVRSDEKNLQPVSGMGKKIFDMAFQDKLSDKKVKSPQEIEKSQGRSFHTYMGLVGRMGNFNDKCNDDPEKFQRSDQRKGKCPPKKNTSGRCPGNGGQAQDMGMNSLPETFNNMGIDLNELQSIIRPCYCPDNLPPGGPQPVCDQRSPSRPMKFTVRADVHNVECPETVTKRRETPGGQENPCNTSQQLQQQQILNRSRRSRSGSPSQPGIRRIPEDAQRNQNGVCVCTSPPCNCPCPRGTVTKPGPSGIAAENPCADPCATVTKPYGGRGPAENPCADPCATVTKPYGGRGPAENPCADPCATVTKPYGARGPGTYLTSFKAPESFTPVTSRPDVTPTGGRTDVGTALRWQRPEVVHCYDKRNPDPSLTEKIDKQWMTTAAGGYKYLDSDYKKYLSREQLIKDGNQIKSRRELFTPQAEPACIEDNQTFVDHNEGFNASPPLQTDPACEYSLENVAGPNSPRGNQQGSCGQQQYQQHYPQCENQPPSSRSPLERGPADTYPVKRNINRPCSPTQGMTKPMNPAYHASSFAVQSNSGRLADMKSVLQGLKQKVESCGGKYESAAVQRTPVNDPACYPGNSPTRTQTKQPAFGDGGPLQTCRNDSPQMRNIRPPQPMFYSPQAKLTQSYTSCLDRGYISLPNANVIQEMSPVGLEQLMRSNAGSSLSGTECYQDEQQNFDECEADNELEEDCDGESMESVDECPPPPQCSPKEVRYKPTGPIREPLKPQTYGKPSPQKGFEQGKTGCILSASLGSTGAPSPGDCGMNMAEAADPCLRPDPRPQTPQNSNSSGNRNASAVNWNSPVSSPPNQQVGSMAKRAKSPAGSSLGWNPQRTVKEQLQRMQPGMKATIKPGLSWTAPIMNYSSSSRGYRPDWESCPDAHLSWSYPNDVCPQRPACVPTGVQEQILPMSQGASPGRGNYSPKAMSPEQQCPVECDSEMLNEDKTLIPQGQGYDQQDLDCTVYSGIPIRDEGSGYMGEDDVTLRPNSYYSQLRCGQPEERLALNMSPIDFRPQVYNQRSQTGNKYLDNSANMSYPFQPCHSTMYMDECDTTPDIEDQFCSDISEIQPQ